MKDEDIIGIYRNGERERAFTEIVKAYSERLFWYVRRYVGCQEDADDLIQEIFVKVWAALPSFRGEARLFTWIYRIATNEALNFLRRQRVRVALNFKSLDAEVERRIDEDPYFNGGEAERRLMKALQKLPQKQRIVFSMRYFEDMSYEEISEVTGTSTGALKASYHIAYEKLKKELV
ncbi:MAG: RNA polymerase sigma factor [Candidatus Cryptobacteroides sp.]|nr:RNA polymerase sigma factor [Bacteroidales bacterium]MDY3963239.1 RNA polymerase sigma factor [Candidatus Cryptobacteroides sp.]